MEKKYALLSTLLTVAVAILSAVVSAVVTWRVNQNDVSVKYVDMAVSVLSAKSGSNDKALRQWAVSVINKHATDGLQLNENLQMRLINGETNLPEAADKMFATGVVEIGKSN